MANISRDIEDIKVEKKVGGSVEASELIEGMVIDKERVHTNMPKNVHDARILLLNEALEIKKTEVECRDLNKITRPAPVIP